mmetsp:Transcript_17455/g.53236  ORF Transcript_17455/g.53236 Transcript_17455/m.53236 type:complete len:198 (-) Transcript_17455:558-1151(-)
MRRSLLVAALLRAATGLAASARTVTWRIETSERKAVSPAFREWFQSAADVPQAVIASSDAISEVQSLGSDRYEAKVAVGGFPFVTLSPIMSFRARRDGDDTVDLTLTDQRMEVEGPAWAQRIVLAAAQVATTNSTSRFSVDDDLLRCESVVETSFNLPRWIPLPPQFVQDNGKAGLQKQVQADLRKSLANLLLNCDD